MITGEEMRNPRHLVDAVLRKPFDYKVLQQEIAKLLAEDTKIIDLRCSAFGKSDDDRFRLSVMF